MPQLTFTHPYYLALLLVLPLGYMASRWLQQRGLRASGSGWFWVLRALGLSLLILALAGMSYLGLRRASLLILAVDVSDSITGPQRQKALDFYNQTAELADEETNLGLLTFAKEAYLQRPPGPPEPISSLRSQPDPTATDVGAALDVAMGYMRPGMPAALVVATDGRSTTGNLEKALLRAQEGRVPIHVLPLGSHPPAEAMVNEVLTPQSLRPKEPFSFQVSITSTNETRALLRIMRNDTPVDEREVVLSSGANVFSFISRENEPGLVQYKAVIYPEVDTYATNNSADGFVLVRGEPSCLVLLPGEEENNSGTDPLEQILAATGLTVKSQPGHLAPSSLAELEGYDLIVLQDVPALSLSEQQQQVLQRFVRDLGGGLLAFGGPRSFGTGGYYGTPLEEALPLYMDVPQRLLIPSLALVLAVDKSGSMGSYAYGSQKIMIAKEAALDVVNVLDPQDSLGIVAFDNQAEWVVPLQEAAAREAIAEGLGRLSASGGTNIYPALQEAYDALRDYEAMVKHIVILSDGKTQKADFGPLLEQIAADRITVSTVAIGEEADLYLLDQIAKLGGGKTYYIDNIHHLPRVLTAEAVRVSRSLTVENTFTPQVLRPPSFAASLPWNDLPPLHGYVATLPKPQADLYLASPEGDPILAAWRYGLGRSVAFTFPASGPWAAEWFADPRLTNLWEGAARWALRAVGGQHLILSAHIAAGRLQITADLLDEEGRYLNFRQVVCRLVPPEGDPFSVHLEQTAPGRYEADVPVEQPGSYLLTASVDDAQSDIRPATLGLVVEPTPEYRAFGPDYAVLRRLTEATGGQLILESSPEAAAALLRAPAGSRRTAVPLWPYLLLTAVCLFTLDIAVRYVPASTWGELAAQIADVPNVILGRVAHEAAGSRRLVRLEDVVRTTKTKAVEDRLQKVARPGYDRASITSAHVYLARMRQRRREEEEINLPG